MVNNSNNDINDILNSIYDRFREYYFKNIDHKIKNVIKNNNKTQFLSTIKKAITTNILYDKVIESDDFKNIDIPISFKKGIEDIKLELLNIYSEVLEKYNIDNKEFEKLYELFKGK